MPVFNGARFLPQIFNVFAEQTFKDFEVIVIDDGSMDGSGDIARALLRKYAIAGHVLSVANRGCEQARDLACRDSRGEIIAPADCDDRWEPVYLEAMTRVLRDHPEIDIVYCDQLDHFADGRPPVLKSDVAKWVDLDKAERTGDLYCFPGGDHFFEMQLSGPMLTPPCTIYRRAVYDRAGPYEIPDLQIPIALDWYFAMRASRIARVAFLKRPLYLRYLHSTNTTHNVVKTIDCKSQVVRHMLRHAVLTRSQRRRARTYIARLMRDVVYQYWNDRRQRLQALKWVVQASRFRLRADVLRLGVFALLPYALFDGLRALSRRRNGVRQ